MRPSGYHIAQVNIGRMKYPTDDPRVADFMNALDEINALADNTPGFVWRLQTEDGNATSVQVFDDPLLLINMSVWESIEALFDYTYKSDHTPFMRRRREWFEHYNGHYMALWYVPQGHIPTPDEAKVKLDLLTRVGPTPEAFTFKRTFTLEDLLSK